MERRRYGEGTENNKRNEEANRLVKSHEGNMKGAKCKRIAGAEGGALEGDRGRKKETQKTRRNKEGKETDKTGYMEESGGSIHPNTCTSASK